MHLATLVHVGRLVLAVWSSELFKSEATQAQPYAQLVAARLRGAGIACTADPLSLRHSLDDIHRYKDQQDIQLDAGGFIEVKSRRLRFTDDPATYPYDTALLDSVTSWNQKTVTPLAIVLVSRATYRMLMVLADTRPAWIVTQQFDRVRGYTSTAYSCHRDQLITFTAGTDYLHNTIRRQNYGV